MPGEVGRRAHDEQAEVEFSWRCKRLIHFFTTLIRSSTLALNLPSSRIA